MGGLNAKTLPQDLQTDLLNPTHIGRMRRKVTVKIQMRKGVTHIRLQPGKEKGKSKPVARGGTATSAYCQEGSKPVARGGMATSAYCQEGSKPVARGGMATSAYCQEGSKPVARGGMATSAYCQEGSKPVARVAPGGHVSPETEQVSSPGSASSTHLEEHDEEDYDDDDDDDDAAAIDTQIQASDHEEVPIETVLPPNRPANTTYDAIVASEGKIVEAENRRHSDLMTVLERMIALQEETVSQLAHLHRVFIEVPKQLQKINTSFEALVVQQTQANYLRMTNVPQFNLNTSQAGSVHAGQFSPHASDLHSPGPNVTGQVADIAVQVPDDILPLPSVQIQQLTPTKEATKTKHKQLLLTSFWSKTTKDTHETDQPSLVQCLPTCSHVSVGTSPVGESLATSPVGESLPKSPVGESLPKSPVGESLPKSPVGESLPKSPVGESLATSPAREVPEATQSGSVVAKVGGKRKRKIQETTSRPVTRSQKEQKK
ncbi:uncharacterized protein LOC142484877 [Ascaphus truei]|uniref:uncharacterized protein LOC142484877 n=1 Tax=Ascaphus truei TaxID=8439 RepID=UPI003F590F21